MTDMTPEEFLRFCNDGADRFKNLPEIEQRAATWLRDGLDPVDFQGRARIPLGTGLYSSILLGLYPVRERRPLAVSDCLAQEDFQRLYEGIALANLDGYVLNSFVTVSWGGVGKSSEEAWRLHQRFTELMQKFFASHRKHELPGSDTLTPRYVWVREVGNRFGDHSHILVHTPDHLQGKFGSWARRAAATLVDAPSEAPVKRCNTLSDLCRVERLRPADAASQWKVFRYLMKGLAVSELERVICPRRYAFLAAEFEQIRKGTEGRVLGQRAGTSRSLGPKQCHEAEDARGGPICSGLSRHPNGLPLPYDDTFLSEGEYRRRMATFLDSLDT